VELVPAAPVLGFVCCNVNEIADDGTVITGCGGRCCTTSMLVRYSS
jgi:hypothetical protein